MLQGRLGVWIFWGFDMRLTLAWVHIITFYPTTTNKVRIHAQKYFLRQEKSTKGKTGAGSGRKSLAWLGLVWFACFFHVVGFRL